MGRSKRKEEGAQTRVMFLEVELVVLAETSKGTFTYRTINTTDMKYNHEDI